MSESFPSLPISQKTIDAINESSALKILPGASNAIQDDLQQTSQKATEANIKGEYQKILKGCCESFTAWHKNVSNTLKGTCDLCETFIWERIRPDLFQLCCIESLMTCRTDTIPDIKLDEEKDKLAQSSLDVVAGRISRTLVFVKFDLEASKLNVDSSDAFSRDLKKHSQSIKDDIEELEKLVTEAKKHCEIL